MMSVPREPFQSNLNESAEPSSHARDLLHRPRLAEESVATIAEESIRKDLEDEDLSTAQLESQLHDEQTLSRIASQELPIGPHSLLGTPRRLSRIAGGPHPFFGTQLPGTIISLEQDVDSAIEEERSLLRDNAIIAPKHPRPRKESQSSVSSRKSLRQRLSVPVFAIPRRTPITEEDGFFRDYDRDVVVQPDETTALLDGDTIDREAPYGGEDDPAKINLKWEEAVLAGKIQTTWQRELFTLLRYTMPLMVAFILQLSLTMTSVFTVGHIGEIELGAVSLGSMTANITGYSVYYGLTSSLDTLCSQAFGSGRKDLVGLQFQRMVYFLWLSTIPIAIIWLAGTEILTLIVPDRQIAELAGLYLKILILGAPAFALFQSAMKFVQAQGRFEATLYVLLIAAPANIFMHWLFVFRFGWGFVGCPIAVVITENLMPVLLFFYVRFFIGLECWPGFTKKALRNWWPMIRLSIPGLIMVIAEMFAFEILVFASARISTTHLAAQSILQSVIVLAYQLPWPLSIAASTRIANLIGATLPDAAKTTARVTFVLGTIFGTINVLALFLLRNYIPRLYVNDPKVIKLAAQTLPINAAFQLADAIAAQCNGVLRGLGQQEVGGYVSLVAYYAIGIPISFGTAFGLHWDLYGLWAGPATSLVVICIVVSIYIYRTSWEKASEEAARRNAAD